MTMLMAVSKRPMLPNDVWAGTVTEESLNRMAQIE